MVDPADIEKTHVTETEQDPVRYCGAFPKRPKDPARMRIERHHGRTAVVKPREKPGSRIPATLVAVALAVVAVATVVFVFALVYWR